MARNLLVSKGSKCLIFVVPLLLSSILFFETHIFSSNLVEPNKDTHTKRVPTRTGALHLDVSDLFFFTGATIQYRMLATGQIYWQGDASYFYTDYEYQAPFKGFKKVDPSILKSEFWLNTESFAVESLHFKVEPNPDRQGRTVANFYVMEGSKTDVNDATGTIYLDTSESMISIDEIKIKGTIFEGSASETYLSMRFTSFPTNGD